MKKHYYYRQKKWIVIASLLDLLGNVFLFFRWCLHKERTLASPMNILIIRLDHLGDILYLLPSLDKLRQHYPKARITLLAGSWTKEITQGLPSVDDIIFFDAPWFARDNKKSAWSNLLAFIKLIMQLRRKKFNLAIDFKGYLWHIFLMWFGGIKYKVSLDDVGAYFLLDKALPRRTDLHAVWQNLSILEAMGIDIEKTSPQRVAEALSLCGTIQQGTPKRGTYADDKETEVRETLTQAGVNLGRDLIAIHCGAGRSSKMWPIKKFNMLIEKLFTQYPAMEVLLIGGKGEEDLVKKLSFTEKQPINLVGKTNLKQLICLLGQCKLFIGNDSGPAHLAAIMGTPTIVLFSKEDDPVQWRPWGDKVTVIQKEAHVFKSLTEEEIANSLDKITVGDILHEVAKILV